MATQAQEREHQVDAQRVAHMRELLSKPGGEEEIARRYGAAAVDGDEAKTARRQMKAVAERQREQREAAAKAQENAEQARRGNEQQNSSSREELGKRLDSANDALDKNKAVIKKQAQSMGKDVQMQSM